MALTTFSFKDSFKLEFDVLNILIAICIVDETLHDSSLPYVELIFVECGNYLSGALIIKEKSFHITSDLHFDVCAWVKARTGDDYALFCKHGV
jgi:hypothetical protein